MREIGGGELSDARARLWDRVLDAEMKRVAVAPLDGQFTNAYKYIPYSLGLERLWPYAYQQDRKTGAWRTEAQFDRVAQELARGESWICGSGWTTWDPYFIHHAEVVLIFQSPWRGMRISLAARRTSTAAAVAGVVRIVLRRRPRFNENGLLIRPLRRPRRGFYSAMAQYAMEDFPEKTFIVKQRADIKKLRAI